MKRKGTGNYHYKDFIISRVDITKTWEVKDKNGNPLKPEIVWGCFDTRDSARFYIDLQFYTKQKED